MQRAMSLLQSTLYELTHQNMTSSQILASYIYNQGTSIYLSSWLIRSHKYFQHVLWLPGLNGTLTQSLRKGGTVKTH